MAGGILILSSDTGGGHRSAAQAITEAVARLGGPPVEMVDALAQGRFPVNCSPRLYALTTLYAPSLWGWAFHLTNAPLRTRFVLRTISLFIEKNLKELLQEKKPEAIVSVHPLINQAVAGAMGEVGSEAPFIIVGTELINVHRAWACPGARYYLMPTRQAKEALLRYGVPEEKVKLIGPPLKPAFSEEKRSRAELKGALELNPTRPVVLFVSGGEGTGRVHDFVQALAGAGLEMQLLVITGRNRKLKARLDEIRFAFPARVYGFVEDMPALMHAADLIVTRAGSITVSEALACALPLVFTGALPGQEEGNIEWVVGAGAGRVAETPPHLVAVLRELLADEEALAKMSERAASLIKRCAVWEIAAFIINAAREASKR
ncbi:MAG TPA: glycosyltransferase [Anaerolineae bacterium]|nr:glycosyltransferase [Anaerolineae bacterium]